MLQPLYYRCMEIQRLRSLKGSSQKVQPFESLVTHTQLDFDWAFLTHECFDPKRFIVALGAMLRVIMQLKSDPLVQF